MIKVEHIEVFNFEGAIRGLRNPMNSWDKSDSKFNVQTYWDEENTLEAEHYDAIIGENDLDLMRRLYKAGPEHRKYLRQIMVSMDITAPRFWWAEFDTYKIGVTRNSCSTMHTIHTKEFDINDFSHDNLEDLKDMDYNLAWQNWINTINMLNHFRAEYNRTHDKRFWRHIIETLPASYNQKATVTMNYENVVNIIHQRCTHKLDEWRDFCAELSKLPYLDEITR